MPPRRTSAARDPGFGISPVKAPAAYELVVEQIRRALALGRFAPGDLLPSERVLTEQLGVSRTVVREAIRVLEGEGLVEVTRGANGGSRVLPAAAEEHLSAEDLRSQIEEVEQVVDFRIAAECAAARLAARRRRKAEATLIDELVDRQEDLLSQAAASESDAERARLTSGFIELDTRFHLAVAAASHNRYLVQAVETGRVNMLRPVGTIFIATTEDVNFQHREIAVAVTAKDPDAAERGMRDHLESTRATTLRVIEDARAGGR
jgi:GntR family transcriptional regulator, transcriptional repressor for pyruvate dehydrogenase complex